MPVMCTYAYTDRPEAEGRFLSISIASRVRVGGVGYTVSDYQYLRYIGPENENENSKTKANGNGNGSGGTRVWPRRPSRGAPENPRRCIASRLHVRVVRRGPMQETRPHLPPLIHPCPRLLHMNALRNRSSRVKTHSLQCMYNSTHIRANAMRGGVAGWLAGYNHDQWQHRSWHGGSGSGSCSGFWVREPRPAWGLRKIRICGRVLCVPRRPVMRPCVCACCVLAKPNLRF